MTDSTPNPRRYSPFWALCVVFLPLIFLETNYVLDDVKQRDQIEANRAQLAASKIPAQSQAINQTTYAIGQDLLALAPSSPEAARIISEFGIQFTQPPSNQPPPTQPTPSQPAPAPAK